MPASIGVNLRVTGYCSQGGRKYMEDFFSVAYQQSEDKKDLEFAFIGIYDGHGGSEAATFAKEHLINLIVNQKLFWSDNDDEILRAIRNGYIATHWAMWREQEKWPKTASGLPSTAGTTASIAFIRHGKIYIGHAGDSGIVLGYTDDNDKTWQVRPLTQDHKPECNVEKERIENSGGKVVIKSGVSRVVWNRPRLGHKGPVRRSTPIDEIPFLAVARSLGDLWSYNSALNEFVVSPEPDVRVLKIDPKKHRCLVFGTDGLWNVLSPCRTVEIVRYAEQINERNANSTDDDDAAGCDGEDKEWINPSKYLVDKALERWSKTKMRADNTSVVILMLDPPGPPGRPKRDGLRGTMPTTAGTSTMGDTSSAIVNDNELMSFDDHDPFDYNNSDNVNDNNFTMYDHSTKEIVDLLDIPPLPTNGLQIMVKYDQNNGEHFDRSDINKSTTDYAMEVNCADDLSNSNSFAESYNSLLNTSAETFSEASNYDDTSTLPPLTYQNVHLHPNSDANLDDADNETSRGDHQQDQFDETYSLTKLETRSEQQYGLKNGAYYDEPSTSSTAMFHEYHNRSQYDLISSSHIYPQQHYHQTTERRSIDEPSSSLYGTSQTQPINGQLITGGHLCNEMTAEELWATDEAEFMANIIHSVSQTETIEVGSPNDIESVNVAEITAQTSLDETIQINEISSSSKDNDEKTKCKKCTSHQPQSRSNNISRENEKDKGNSNNGNKLKNNSVNVPTEKEEAELTTAATLCQRVTRSQYNNPNLLHIVVTSGQIKKKVQRQSLRNLKSRVLKFINTKAGRRRTVCRNNATVSTVPIDSRIELVQNENILLNSSKRRRSNILHSAGTSNSIDICNRTLRSRNSIAKVTHPNRRMPGHHTAKENGIAGCLRIKQNQTILSGSSALSSPSKIKLKTNNNFQATTSKSKPASNVNKAQVQNANSTSLLHPQKQQQEQYQTRNLREKNKSKHSDNLKSPSYTAPLTRMSSIKSITRNHLTMLRRRSAAWLTTSSSGSNRRNPVTATGSGATSSGGGGGVGGTLVINGPRNKNYQHKHK